MTLLPRFGVVVRHRPIAIVGTPAVAESFATSDGPAARTSATPHLAPFAAIEVALPSSGTTAATLAASDGSSLQVRLTDDRVSLRVTAGGSTTEHRSRRSGRARRQPTRLGLALTGTFLTALTLEGTWVVRGRVDLTDRDGLDVRDPDWLADLRSGWTSTGSVTDWSAGGFGQLGLRDIRLVTNADGSPHRVPEGLLLTATSAGPGFFATAHTSVWLLTDDDKLRHRADLFFRRPEGPGVFGDHATHLLRDGDRWLVATSTWSDFPAKRTPDTRVAITLATSTADLTTGSHLLDTLPLHVPATQPSVGVWDPHLVRAEDGTWLVGYVSARRFFDFHPELGSGPSLDALTLRGAATDRRATEGTTIVRVGDAWRVLASDGRDNPRHVRARFPMFDLDLAEVGAVEASYPTNIPWPSVVAPDPEMPDDTWRLVTFDGTPTGGRSAGYGTHGDVVIQRAVR